MLRESRRCLEATTARHRFLILGAPRQHHQYEDHYEEDLHLEVHRQYEDIPDKIVSRQRLQESPSM
jgi:hypothetical protein